MTTTVFEAPHRLTAARLADELGTDPESGLRSAEAAARLERYGPNTPPPARRRGPAARFLLQFNSPLIYVLLVSAVITALLGEHVDAAVILGVVLVNAIVGFVQESRAEAALAALAALTETVTTVVRDGEARRLPSQDLVRGDLVLLGATVWARADAPGLRRAAGLRAGAATPRTRSAAAACATRWSPTSASAGTALPRLPVGTIDEENPCGTHRTGPWSLMLRPRHPPPLNYAAG